MGGLFVFRRGCDRDGKLGLFTVIFHANHRKFQVLIRNFKKASVD
jgi:hypothetical protein